MADLQLEAKKRELTTKGAVKQLRKDGYVPGVYYVKGGEPLAFTVLASDLNPLVYTTETHVINMNLEGTELRCLLKDIQFDPVSDKVVHVDFKGIKDDEVTDIEIPIKLVGTAEGVRGGGKLHVGIHKIKIECLPKDIPGHIEINISDLKVGQAIHVRDLSYDNIKILTNGQVQIVAVATSRNVVATEEKEG